VSAEDVTLSLSLTFKQNVRVRVLLGVAEIGQRIAVIVIDHIPVCINAKWIPTDDVPRITVVIEFLSRASGQSCSVE